MAIMSFKIRIGICNSLSAKLNNIFNRLIVNVIVTLITTEILLNIKPTIIELNAFLLRSEIRLVATHYRRSVFPYFLSFDPYDIR